MTEKQEISAQQRSRRKKEGILILVILVIVGGLTIVETRLTPFGTDLSLSSTVLMFILININLLPAAHHGSLLFFHTIYLHFHCFLV